MLTDSLLWCTAQVTFVAILTWLLCKCLSSKATSSATILPSTGLIAITLLTVSAFVPWPSWWRFGPDLESMPRETSSVPAGAFSSRSMPQSLPLKHSQSENTSVSIDVWPTEVLLKSEEEPRMVLPIATESASNTLVELLPLVFAVIFGGGMVIGLTRFLSGILVVRAYKQASQPLPDPGLIEVVDCLRAEFSLRRSVEILECKQLATAATIGWFQPVILLPPSWRNWKETQLHAVLAHELAHVSRGDFLMCALAQLTVTLHFYHPLVHWLVGKLRAEQEFAADAIAARMSGGRKLYLQSLAELALDTSEQSLGWPAHTFLPTQGTLLRRIEMLRDFQTTANNGSIGPMVWRMAAVVLLIVGSFMIAGLRGGSSATPFIAAANAQTSAATSDTQKIDLSFVTNDAKMVMAIRPKELAKVPEINELLTKAVSDGALPFIKLMMDDVKQVTIINLPQRNVGEPVVVLQFNRPTTFELIAKAGAWPAEALRLPAAASADSKPHSPAYTVLNEQTIALGSLEMVGKYLANRRKGQPAIATSTGWDQLGGSALVVALDMELLREEFNNDGTNPVKEPLVKFLAPVAPLWTDSEFFVGGIRIEGKTIDLKAIMTCQDSKLAENVEETARAATTFARNMLRSVRENERDIPAFALLSMDAADTLLKSIKVEREETRVTVQSSTDAPAAGSAVAKNLAQAISQSRVAAQRSVSMNNLKQIMLALHNWAAAHEGRFPPPVIMGKDGKGKVPHSWRVEILPYLDQQELYDSYQFDEPWDSEANKRVLARIPPLFRHPLADSKSTDAAYFVLTSEKLLEETIVPGGGMSAPVGGFPTAFSARNGLPFIMVPDGLSNTFAVVEAKREIPWTKPEDILFDPTKDPPKLGGFFKEGFNVGICDGSVRFVSQVIDAKTLKLLIMPGDGTPIQNY